MFDVIFEEDLCRVDDRTIIQNLNILQKLALNLVKSFKAKSNLQKTVSKIMFDFLFAVFESLLLKFNFRENVIFLLTKIIKNVILIMVILNYF